MPKQDLHIVSWNINGVRAAARKGLMRRLAALKADIVALQEVRASPARIPASVVKSRTWLSSFSSAEREGYSGVGLLSKQPLDSISTTLGVSDIDAEGRVQIAQSGGLTLVNGYFPNGSGSERDNSRVPFKLAFYRRLFETLRPAFEAGAPILVMGDFNTAHREIDLARPRQNRKTSGFLPVECEEFQRVIDMGWTDTFRHFEAGPGHYSWWSQRFGVREKNIGWRIDYVLASPGALPYVRAAAIHPRVLGSDHCPISVRLDRRVLALDGRAPRR